MAIGLDTSQSYKRGTLKDRVYSGSSGDNFTTTGSNATPPNNSVTITTFGRPVKVGLAGSPHGGASDFVAISAANGNGQFRWSILVKEAPSLGGQVFNSNGPWTEGNIDQAIPCSAFTRVYDLPAGTWTFQYSFSRTTTFQSGLFSLRQVHIYAEEV